MQALSHNYAGGDLHISHSYAFATATGAPVGGGYMTIRNDGPAGEVLLAVRVDSSIAGNVELHTMAMEGDVLRMRAVEGGVRIPAGGRVELAPGGVDVLYMRLPARLAGYTAPHATLMFETASKVAIEIPVEARGVRDHADRHDPDRRPVHADGIPCQMIPLPNRY